MSLKPCNRHLLVQVVEEQEEEKSSILMPEDYTVKSAYAKVSLQDKSDDCTLKAPPGSMLLVNNAMMEEISVEEDTYYLILENHVLGILD